jgi:hypothetical protein
MQLNMYAVNLVVGFCSCAVVAFSILWADVLGYILGE